MARSITFTLDGILDTEITIFEQDDGTLLFELEATNGGSIGDLRGLFFDLTASDPIIDGISVTGPNVADFDSGNDAITNLGGGVNVNGDVVDEFGAFDVGVAFGSSGIGMDDLQVASFTLDSSAGDLTLDMLSEVDFGIQYTSLTGKNGKRKDGEKVGGQSTAALLAVDDALGVDEDTVNSANVLTNDAPPVGTVLEGGMDAGGDLTLGLNIVTTDGGRTGYLELKSDGTAEFRADSVDFDSLAKDETDTYTFTYHALAPNGSTACADVTVTITGVNDDPVANDDMANATENGPAVPIAVLANDTDVDSDDDNTTLVVTSASSSSGATVNVSGIAGAAIGYLPDSFDFNFLDHGDTYTDTITYTVMDSHGATDTAEVEVTVTGVNDAPVANDEMVMVGEDGPAITINVFANDNDPDADDPLTILSIDTTGTLGGVSLQDLNGNISYDPNGQFLALNDGETAVDTFTYTLEDSQGVQSTSMVSVTVKGRTQVENMRVLEPDGFADDTVLDSAFANVTMSAYDRGTDTVVASIIANAVDDTSTGDKAFSNAETGIDGWTVAGDAFRIDFDNPVTAFSIDVISNSNFAFEAGSVHAYSGDDVLIDQDATGFLGDAGDFETLNVVSATGDIAFVEVFSNFGSVNFDHIEFTELI